MRCCGASVSAPNHSPMPPLLLMPGYQISGLYRGTVPSPFPVPPTAITFPFGSSTRLWLTRGSIGLDEICHWAVGNPGPLHVLHDRGVPGEGGSVASGRGPGALLPGMGLFHVGGVHGVVRGPPAENVEQPADRAERVAAAWRGLRPADPADLLP